MCRGQCPWAEGQIKKVGLFDKDGGDEKNTSLSQMSAVKKSFWVCKVRAVMTQGRKGAKDCCPFSPFSVFHLQHVSQIEEGVEISAKGCLMSFWGMVFREGRQRKETGQPQSWATHPPRWDLYPRSRAKRGSTKNSLPHQSNNLPMFYQQLSKQCFPGLEKCHTLLFPKQLLLPFVILVSYWLF